MIVFELTMSNAGSWNGRWSGENNRHCLFYPEHAIPASVLKEILDQDFYYTWDDGWTACVSVFRMNGNSKEYHKLRNINRGFYGYDWMVRSIIRNHRIISSSVEKG